jgi:hypothetical protein
MKMHQLFFPNGFEKTECVGKKLKNIAPNVSRLGEVAEHKTSLGLQILKFR